MGNVSVGGNMDKKGPSGLYGLGLGFVLANGLLWYETFPFARAKIESRWCRWAASTWRKTLGSLSPTHLSVSLIRTHRRMRSSSPSSESLRMVSCHHVASTNKQTTHALTFHLNIFNLAGFLDLPSNWGDRHMRQMNQQLVTHSADVQSKSCCITCTCYLHVHDNILSNSMQHFGTLCKHMGLLYTIWRQIMSDLLRTIPSVHTRLKSHSW